MLAAGLFRRTICIYLWFGYLTMSNSRNSNRSLIDNQKRFFNTQPPVQLPSGQCSKVEAQLFGNTIYYDTNCRISTSEA